MIYRMHSSDNETKKEIEISTGKNMFLFLLLPFSFCSAYGNNSISMHGVIYADDL